MKDVLIVDDSKAFRSFLKSNLAEKDFNFIEAEDGVIALEKINDHEIELIILDYNMPRMDGLEFLKQLRAQQKFNEVPVIMLTAEREASKMTDSYSCGATVYVTKPFEKETLIKVIDSLVFWHVE